MYRSLHTWPRVSFTCFRRSRSATSSPLPWPVPPEIAFFQIHLKRIAAFQAGQLIGVGHILVGGVGHPAENSTANATNQAQQHDAAGRRPAQTR